MITCNDITKMNKKQLVETKLAYNEKQLKLFDDFMDCDFTAKADIQQVKANQQVIGRLSELTNQQLKKQKRAEFAQARVCLKKFHSNYNELLDSMTLGRKSNLSDVEIKTIHKGYKLAIYALKGQLLTF